MNLGLLRFVFSNTDPINSSPDDCDITTTLQEVESTFKADDTDSFVGGGTTGTLVSTKHTIPIATGSTIGAVTIF